MLFQFLRNQEMLDFKMLRNTQGLQAPLKLQMERAVASKVNHTACSTICNHTFCIIIIALINRGYWVNENRVCEMEWAME